MSTSEREEGERSEDDFLRYPTSTASATAALAVTAAHSCSSLPPVLLPTLWPRTPVEPRHLAAAAPLEEFVYPDVLEFAVRGSGRKEKRRESDDDDVEGSQEEDDGEIEEATAAAAPVPPPPPISMLLPDPRKASSVKNEEEKRKAEEEEQQEQLQRQRQRQPPPQQETRKKQRKSDDASVQKQQQKRRDRKPSQQQQRPKNKGSRNGQTPPTPTPTSTTKRLTCDFYLQGRCLRGSECAFSHAGVTPVTKHIRCKYHARGECMKGGEACEFSHDALASEPCGSLLLSGSCARLSRGLPCDRLHDFASLGGIEVVDALRERMRKEQEKREKLGLKTVEGWRGEGERGQVEEVAAVAPPAPPPPPPPPRPAPEPWLSVEEARRLVSSGAALAAAGGAGNGDASTVARATTAEAKAASDQLAGFLSSRQ